jgi:hypothetical protein
MPEEKKDAGPLNAFPDLKKLRHRPQGDDIFIIESVLKKNLACNFPRGRRGRFANLSRPTI